MPDDGQKTRRLLLRGAIAFGAGAVLPGIGLAQERTRAAARWRPFPVSSDGDPVAQIRHVETGEPVLALTFDDGPDPNLTPRVLDMLGARGIRASFFVVGERASHAPDLLARMAREGHEIGNHSWSHPHMGQMSDQEILDEIDRTAMTVAAATGFAPVLMRPPYGEFDLRQSRMLRVARDLPTILWSVDPQDWRRPPGWEISDHILSHAHRGAVILAHDIVPATLRNLPRMIDGLSARGYRFVTVSELLGWPFWTRHRRV